MKVEHVAGGVLVTEVSDLCRLRTMLADLPDPDYAGARALILEQDEAKCRYAMTRGMRLELGRLRGAARTSLRKEILEVLGARMASDQMWLELGTGGGDVPESEFAKALSGAQTAIVALISEVRALRERVK